MGADSRRPPLPAPTDISSSGLETSDDLATDISRATDRTSYSIPDDGTPVTIRTNKVGRSKDEGSKELLIEYFDGSKVSKGVASRPSLRVRVTQPGSKKSRREGEHIQITETGRSRKPSYTRRISLPQSSDDRLASSEISDTSSGRPPVEVEVLQGTSDLSQGRDESPTRYIVPASDISSMPPDSLLEGSIPAIITPRARSPSLEHERPSTMDTLKAPIEQRSRSLSRERIAQSAIKKIQERQAGTSSNGKQKMASRRSSGSSTREYVIDESASPKSRSWKSREEERLGTHLEPSEISAVSDQSTGKYSARSGVSTTSINNPKLLSAVEDAIKRLILPELNAVKEEQKRQKNRMTYDDMTRDSMAPVGSRENLRRVSKSSSSPNVAGKPGIVTEDRRVVDTDEPIKVRKRRSRSGSEKSHETAIREETSRRSSREKRDKHSVGKMAAAAIAGGALTAAALKHHDSIQDMNEDQERRERRKRRSKSKSRSRTTSISDTYEDHSVERGAGSLGVPPLPLQQSSAVGTDRTRDSILSAETDHLRTQSESVDQFQHYKTPEAAQEASRQLASTSPRTPTKTPANLHSHSPNDALRLVEAGVTGAGLAAAGEQFLAQHNRVRSLRSGESLSSGPKARQHQSNFSIDSIGGSPTSRKHYEGFNEQETREAFEDVPYSPESAQPGVTDQWFEQEHERNEQLRREYEDESQVSSNQRHTMYTDDSYTDDYDKSFESGRDIRAVGANPEYVHTPAAVESAVASLHEPSLLGSIRSSQKTDSVHDVSQFDGEESPRDFQVTDSRVGTSKERWEAIRDQAIANARHNSSPQQSDASIDEHPVMGASAIPLQDEPMPEIGHGFDDESEVDTNPSIIKGPIGGLEHGDRSHWPYDPTPAIPNRESSVPEDHDHTTRDLAFGTGVAAAAGAVGLGLAASRSKESNRTQEPDISAAARQPSLEQTRSQEWVGDRATPPANADGAPAQFGYSSPAGGRGIDEGYMSGAVPGGELTPDPYLQDREFDNASLDQYDEADDPFTTSSKRLRYASGMSHGMASPLYDAATGKGIDRIKDRDIVALMDHLTVRDAQRNARDTEILVTLVRNAAEMRNQWEDMKKFLQDQDRLVMGHNEKMHDKTVQRVIGGPRPIPAASTRAPRRQISDETDDSTKAKKNFLRRAFKGMSSKNNQDLTKIEGMLMQLLDEVEDLKSSPHLLGAGGSQQAPQDSARSNSLGSYDALRTVPDPGYEPDGMAGTSSSPAQSGYLSNPSSKHIGTMHSGFDARRSSEGNRISTVLERDEEDEEWTPQSAPVGSRGNYANNDGMLTPTQEVRRGASVPLDTPPDQRLPLQNSRSAEDTPRTDRSRKHKSGASSIFNKMSRWSKTTASTVQDPDSVRNSAKKEQPYSTRSRSGEELPYDEYDDYSPRENATRRSRASIDSQTRGGAQPRSPSPLIPEQRRSMDEPKYRSHERDSLVLEHPQPRPGPTERNRDYLEYQALDYENPPTPDVDQWGTTPALALNRNMNRFSDSSGQPAHDLSPIHSEDGADAYSDHSASEQAHNRLPSQGPPRPPKIRDGEGPLVPPKIPFNEEQAGSDNNYAPQSVGFGYHSPYSNSGMHIASPLEPIEEVRYSLETDRSSYRRDQMTPSPRPTAMQSVQRKITGPREMPKKTASQRVESPNLQIPRKTVGEERKSPVPSLESYRSSLDEF